MAKEKQCDCKAWAGLTLRIALGLVFLFSGWAKLSAGPAGFGGALSSLGFPAALALAWIVALVEFVGGIMLLAGVYARWTAIPLAVIIVVALLLKWAGNFGSAGFADISVWRIDLMLLAALLSVYWIGSGKWSLDSLWTKA